MADLKISQLTGATTPLAGTEVVPVVQSGSTKKVAVSDLTAGRDVAALSLTGGNVKLSGNAIETTDTNGNLVINPNGSGAVTLHGTANAWQAGYQALQWNTGAGAAVMSSGDDTHVLTNAYFNGGYKYQTAGSRAVDYVQTGGRHIWRAAGVASNANDPLTWSEYGRFDTNGDFDLSQDIGGNVKFRATKGIDFSANTNAPGMTSELLTWYEEGNWTPSIGGNATYLQQLGRYVRVGKQVTVSFVLQVNVKGTGSDNTISGLPFAVGATNQYHNAGALAYFDTLALSVVSITPRAVFGSSTIDFSILTAAASAVTTSGAVIGNGTYFIGSMTYLVD